MITILTFADFRREFLRAAKNSGVSKYVCEEIFDSETVDDIVWIWRGLAARESIYFKLSNNALEFLHNAAYHSQWLNVGREQSLRIYKIIR